jgi:glycosyltransferase involved in cell wall biosynthesis
MHALLFANMTADYSVEYANALAKRFRVTLLAPSSQFGNVMQYLDNTVSLHLLDWPRHRSPSNICFLLRLWVLTNRIRPDVLHFLSEGVTWLGFFAAIASRKYNVVTTMHDVEYHPGDHESRRLPRWFVGMLLNHSDKVIVHGARLKTDAERLYPALRGRVEVLPHMIMQRYLEIAKTHRLRRSDDPTINILFFGRIYAYKGLDVLIRSISTVAERMNKFRVVIAGRGENIDIYLRMMVDPSLFEVRNRYIPDLEAAQLFTDADMVVLPYVEASQSGVLAIASAFGKPVIVTDVGELGRTVTDGATGIVIPPGDEQALAEAVLRLATDEALRAAFGSALRCTVAEAAAPETVAEAALRIYESVGQDATEISVASSAQPRRSSE